MSESLNEMKRNMKITKRQQQNQKTIFGVELAIFVDYAKYEKYVISHLLESSCRWGQ